MKHVFQAVCCAAAVYLFLLMGIIAGPGRASASPVVKAIAQRTASAGWPHSWTPREQIAVARHALRLMTPDDHVGVDNCQYPTKRVSTAVCRGTAYWITLDPATETQTIKFHYRWAIRFKFYEDGSYKLRVL